MCYQVAREARGAAEAALSLQQEAADLGAALSLIKADTEATQRRSVVQLREELLARWNESQERVLSAQRELAQQQDSARQDQAATATALASLQRQVQQEMQPSVDHLAAALAASEAKTAALSQMLLDVKHRQGTAVLGAAEVDAPMTSAGKGARGSKKRTNPDSGDKTTKTSNTKLPKAVPGTKLVSTSDKSSQLSQSNRSGDCTNDDLNEGGSVHSNASSSSSRYSPSSIRRLSKVLGEEAMVANEDGNSDEEGDGGSELDEDDDDDECIETAGQGPESTLVQRFDDLKLAQVNQQLSQLHAASLVAAEEIGRLRGSQLAGEKAQQRSTAQLGDLQRSLVFVEGRVQAVDGDLQRGLAAALRRIDDVSEQVKILLRYNASGIHDTTSTPSAPSVSPTSTIPTTTTKAAATTTATTATTTTATTATTTTTTTVAAATATATAITSSATTVSAASDGNTSSSASGKGLNKVSFDDDDGAVVVGGEKRKSLLGRLWDIDDGTAAIITAQPPLTPDSLTPGSGSASRGGDGDGATSKAIAKGPTTIAAATTAIATTPGKSLPTRTPVQGKLGPASTRPRANSEASEGSAEKEDHLAINSHNSSSDDNDLVRARREERRTKVT